MTSRNPYIETWATRQRMTDEEIAKLYAGRRYDEPGMVVRFKPSVSRGRAVKPFSSGYSAIRSSMGAL